MLLRRAAESDSAAGLKSFSWEGDGHACGIVTDSYIRPITAFWEICGAFLPDDGYSEGTLEASIV